MLIADDIAAKIQDGTYPPNGRLPSLADLVHEYGAANGTVRKAVEELRERGLIETISGKGSFVVPPDERPAPQSE
jgi:DNA-binding GntR family transcriptional regulator